MIVEKKIMRIRQQLLRFKHKKKAIFLDDFEMIEECKHIITDEIENYISKNTSKTEEEVFAKIFNFFHFEVHSKKYERNIVKTILFSLTILVMWLTSITILSPFILVITFLIITLYLFTMTNAIKKEIDTELRINYIIDEALNELKEEFEEERTKQFLEPVINVQLEQEEINELLNEDFFEDDIKPDITTKTYDRKTSLERRKRRRNLKSK